LPDSPSYAILVSSHQAFYREFLPMHKRLILSCFTLLILVGLPACRKPNHPLIVTATVQQEPELPTFETTMHSSVLYMDEETKAEWRQHPPPGLSRQIKDLTLPQLKAVRDYSLAVGNLEDAIKYTERWVLEATDPAELKKLRLELADLYFETGKFDRAGALFLQYISAYPGSDQREYAEYKGILCRFYGTLSSDRDQAKTHEAVALSDLYLGRPDINTTYSDEVKNIKMYCCKKLFEHEKMVFNFYLNRGSFKAAEKRLSYIKEHYVPLLSDQIAEVLALDIELARQQGKDAVVAQKEQELREKFPLIALAEKPARSGRKAYAQRF
jgi:outer membrane assembly lipoprotein YfiO